MSFNPIYVGIDECDKVDGTAVVVDVLRAFTTAAWAFHLGVERIILCADIDEALRLKQSIPGALALKDSKPLPGFELSNSPVQLRSVAGLSGRTIVQRTTHGTVGAVAARHAEELCCASFVNARATASALRTCGASEAYFVATGEGGSALEDRACAEYIARLVDDPSVEAVPFLQEATASPTAELLRRRVAEQTPGVHPDDIDACLDADRFDFFMRARVEDGLLVLRSYNCNDG